MAIRNILTEDEPTLRKKCRDVTVFDDRVATLIDDMRETLAQANGVGLAAPQVGVLRKIVLVDNEDGVVELINPQIIEKSGEQEAIEGCLSVPGVFGMTHRPLNVTVRAYDRHGKVFTVKSKSDLAARCFCHEIDHLSGVLFIDHAHILSQEELDELYDED